MLFIIEERREEKREKTIIKLWCVSTLGNRTFAYSLLYHAGLEISLPGRVHTQVVAVCGSSVSGSFACLGIIRTSSEEV